MKNFPIERKSSHERLTSAAEKVYRFVYMRWWNTDENIYVRSRMHYKLKQQSIVSCVSRVAYDPHPTDTALLSSKIEFYLILFYIV